MYDGSERPLDLPQNLPLALKTGRWDVSFGFAQSEQENFVADSQDRRSPIPHRAKLIQLGQKNPENRRESVTLLHCKAILHLQLLLHAEQRALK